MRAYFASPYASHITNRDDAVWAATRSLVRLRGIMRPVLHVDEVAGRDNVIWSPLIQGQFILWERGGRWDERLALAWCLHCLQFKFFDTLVISDTIPRAKGYGANGVDREHSLAEKLGLNIISETDILTPKVGRAP